MKNVLMIANQYPPMGGSGVQRSAKFAKYLPESGYSPIVLTREQKAALMDQSLLEETKDHKIIRTKSYDLTQLPGPLSYVGKFISRRCLIPDGDIIWAKQSMKVAMDLIDKEKIDLIYSTSFPYSDHLLGLELKKRYPKIPWVVDFRDEWTKNPYILDMKYPQKRLEKEARMEREVIDNCDAFITNTKYMLANFMEDIPSLKNKSFVITNGYDDSDFTKIKTDYQYNDEFCITYTGAMYGRRNPVKFFQAVRELMNEGRIREERLKIRFIGNVDTKKLNQWISIYHLENQVELVGYLPHKESIEELAKANALLLLIGEGPGAKNFSSGKIFEYINSHRPILALVPEDGAAAEIIQETKSGIISDMASVRAIKEGLLKLYEEWEAKEVDFEPDWKAIAKYHRRELTKQLSKVFDQVLSQQG